MIIQHNLSAMNANRQLNVNVGNKQKAMEKLSSGYRINRAADDAAGLGISEKMRGQIRGLNRGTTNIQRVKNVPNSMSIFPPVVDKNTNLNITFGDENKEGSEIVIHSASGSLIKTANVPSGQRNTSIRISNSRGIYNVSRVKNGNVIESKKIAVK